MLVDAASFKINTSTNENISELDVSLYPNPVKGLYLFGFYYRKFLAAVIPSMTLMAD